MVNDPLNPDHAANEPVEIPNAVVVPVGIAGYAKALTSGATMIIGTVTGALLDGKIDGGEVGLIIGATVAAFGLVAAVRNKSKVVAA